MFPFCFAFNPVPVVRAGDGFARPCAAAALLLRDRYEARLARSTIRVCGDECDRTVRGPHRLSQDATVALANRHNEHTFRADARGTVEHGAVEFDSALPVQAKDILQSLSPKPSCDRALCCSLSFTRPCRAVKPGCKKPVHNSVQKGICILN